MDTLKDIWNNNKKPIANEDLKAYAENALSTDEQFALELQFNDEDFFEQDAIEGLKENNPKNLGITLLELNKRIEKTLIQKKKKRKVIDTTNTNTIAIITILGLIIVGFIVIRMFVKKG